MEIPVFAWLIDIASVRLLCRCEDRSGGSFMFFYFFGSGRSSGATCE